MVQIKFRGKLLNDSKAFKTYKKGTIIEGGYCKQGDKHFIVAHFNVFEVEPNSVQQNTPFKDNEGNEIFVRILDTEYVSLFDVLKRYEQWEAKLIEDVDSWENGYPSITGELFDEFLEIQELRNKALSSYES